ncbi:hypothetical protein [Neorhizobium galegae]|uniref:hypothetical protein n=1 Tax=Neorhizobium galegae TaxID=399 RepID=UPI00210501C1|nr:hypothetical protein [Neorhizobium galegae]MCQ1853060.1 hypothetical protein [Neorhizobium galegae]
MLFPETVFVVHDISAFPIVTQRRDAVRPGYAAQWMREMESLLQSAAPFVIILEQGQAEEESTDRKARGLWLKRNKHLLAPVCRAVIGIEGDGFKRAAFKTLALVAAKAFGMTMDVVASDGEAVVCARAILDRSGS